MGTMPDIIQNHSQENCCTCDYTKNNFMRKEDVKNVKCAQIDD
jgi:hypothetical protein